MNAYEHRFPVVPVGLHEIHLDVPPFPSNRWRKRVHHHGLIPVVGRFPVIVVLHSQYTGKEIPHTDSLRGHDALKKILTGATAHQQ